MPGARWWTATLEILAMMRRFERLSILFLLLAVVSRFAVPIEVSWGPAEVVSLH